MAVIRRMLCRVFRAAVWIGIVAIASMALGVMFSVVMRYFFNQSFTWIDGIITKIFVFTTFWGVGICIVWDEHISIDYLQKKLPDKARLFVRALIYSFMLVLFIVMILMGAKWIQTLGEQVNYDTQILAKYLYVLQPISLAFAALCTVYKLLVLFFPGQFRIMPEDNIKPALWEE